VAASAFKYYRANRRQFLRGLKNLLSIPSISTLPEHKDDVRCAAEFIRKELRDFGFKRTQLIEGKRRRNPLVYAEWLGAPGKPVLLLYGHYDVQPPDPLEEWLSPPFKPTVRGDDIFARGASDDKGQTYILLKAVEGFLEAEGKLPVNVKFLIEGEEEIGGGHIGEYIPTHVQRLKADAAVICDTEMFAPGLPTITTGLRGMVYTELEARGARHDLHSGMYGGTAPNPVEALSQIIAAIKGQDGKVRIPGFYNRVKKPLPKELEGWETLPFNEKRYLKNEIGSAELTGEKGFSVLERLWARPTFEVHGIRGGFVAEGAKTVIPAVATAKISMRLVPDMRPEEVIRQYTAAVKKLTPRGIKTRVRVLSSAPASLVSPENHFVRTAARAMEQIFGKKTVYMRSGGSIPVAGQIQDGLGIPVVMMGFGLPDDRLHSPNEKFHLPNFYGGIEAMGRFFELLTA
jgi:acetylornithine deacetylase/succinyl-diaminopimelate desuccinylase-like protein